MAAQAGVGTREGLAALGYPLRPNEDGGVATNGLRPARLRPTYERVAAGTSRVLTAALEVSREMQQWAWRDDGTDLHLRELAHALGRLQDEVEGAARIVSGEQTLRFDLELEEST